MGRSRSHVRPVGCGAEVCLMNCACMSACVLLFSHSVVSDSLQTHGLQHARLPCPSLSPGVCSTSCPLSHPAILSSIAPFSSFPQSFSASGSFPMNWFFTSDDQSIGASAPASVLPMNIQGWFPLGLTGLISLLSKGTLKSLLQHDKMSLDLLNIP